VDRSHDCQPNVASVAKQAIVKAMRLAQITSGFVGGVQQIDIETGELLDFEDPDSSSGSLSQQVNPIRMLSSEKIDGTLKYLSERFHHVDRILIWSRHRLEIERMAAAAGQQRSRTGRSTCCTASSPLPTARLRWLAEPRHPGLARWAWWATRWQAERP
jgi:hypothetical protein